MGIFTPDFAQLYNRKMHLNQRISPKTVALIVAAGTSQRMGGGKPKQYRDIAGKSVLRRSVEIFLQHPLVDAVQVVIHPAYQAEYEKATQGLALLPPSFGGATRQESVHKGLENLADLFPLQVLVHDAARCFVDAEVITRVIESLANKTAVLPVMPLPDTIKKVENGTVTATIPRENMFTAQTPQGFDFNTLLALHRSPSAADATDDAMLAEAAGIQVECVAGNEKNFKITQEDDWMRAERLATQALEYRTGSGFDVHKLVAFPDATPLAEQVVHICGVKISHKQGLEGHSDADVGLHALVDALLGALALGDIGTHFPPSDPQWKGADSSRFVTYCREKMAERGAKLVNADITLICEAPKIGPHRQAMQSRVADLLHVATHRINVKATTSEELGFTGRREGIAAQAVVSIAIQEDM